MIARIFYTVIFNTVVTSQLIDRASSSVSDADIKFWNKNSRISLHTNNILKTRLTAQYQEICPFLNTRLYFNVRQLFHPIRVNKSWVGIIQTYQTKLLCVRARHKRSLAVIPKCIALIIMLEIFVYIPSSFDKLRLTCEKYAYSSTFTCFWSRRSSWIYWRLQRISSWLIQKVSSIISNIFPTCKY